jgi:hypothetical protein
MRNLVFLLVLANGLFWAWEHWLRPRPGTQRVDEAVEGGLTLVSELGDDPDTSLVATAEPATNAAPPAEVEVAAVQPLPTRCFSLGPFRDLPEAARIGSSLKRAGLAPNQRVGEGDIWIGYWVHIDNLNTRAEAEKTLRGLREGGVTDSYIVSEDGGHGISLGVFSEIKRAGTRREQVKALGFDPVVTDRSRRGTVYWVDLELDNDEQLDLESLQQGRIVRLEERDCDQGAEAG